MKIGFAFGLVNQISNFYCHILLRNLRSTEGGGYQIPQGFLFNIVTCANYTTEIYQWLGFNIATQTIAGYVFMVVAAGIMTNWALAKHRRLKKVTSFPVAISTRFKCFRSNHIFYVQCLKSCVSVSCIIFKFFSFWQYFMFSSYFPLPSPFGSLINDNGDDSNVDDNVLLAVSVEHILGFSGLRFL